MNQLAKEYEKETGVKVEVETLGGGVGYSTGLKAKLVGQTEPDIFNNPGYSDMDDYMDRLTDLSNEPWVSRVPEFAKQAVTRDGKIYGMPVGLEGHGLVYNKDLFAKAGITTPPVTLSEFKEAFKKLKDAGIKPIATGFGETFVLGQFQMIATALHEDPIQFSRDVASGAKKIADDPYFQGWLEFFDLAIEYAEPNPLTTDYNTQVTMFASGEVAMMGQGNWTQAGIDKIDPNLNVGLLAFPVGDAPDQNGYITGGSPNYWVVNSKGQHPEEAKAFLNWLVTSETGKRFIVEEFKFIPALDGIEYDPKALGGIATDIIEYSRAGKMLTWNTDYPGRDSLNKEFGSVMQSYIGKQIKREEVLPGFDAAIERLKK